MSKVVLYSTSNCPLCAKYRTLLAEKGISYEERIHSIASDALFFAGTPEFQRVNLPFVYRNTGLTKSAISYRISDHYPLWVEFSLT